MVRYYRVDVGVRVGQLMVEFLRMFHGPAPLRAAAHQRCGFLFCSQCVPQDPWFINSSRVSLQLTNTDGDH